MKKVTVTRPFYIGADLHQPGDVIEVADTIAGELITANKAVAGEVEVAKPAPKGKAKKGAENEPE